MNAATAHIDVACDMVGSFTMYQSMKEPNASAAVESTARRSVKNLAASR